jgi:uncharacterized membrane protein
MWTNFPFRFVFSVFLTVLFFGPAQAEFKICNQTVAVYNVAIGAEKDRKFSTEGWWILPANSCVSPLKEDLDVLRLQYIYVYATTVSGEAAIAGNSDMCIDTKRFNIEKIPNQPWNCWVRGFQFAKFKEVDTGSTKSWTLFIRDVVTK